MTDTPNRSRCADCGAALSGPFCGQCGQSDQDIRQPVRTLFTDFIGDAFVWDGRIWRTLRRLFANPGALARAYANGQRARWTQPIRLYLVISLAFFSLMALAGVRVLAVNITPDAQTVRAQDAAVVQQRRDRLDQAIAEATRAGNPPPQLCGVAPGPDELAENGALRLAQDTSVMITLFLFTPTPEGRELTAEDAECLDTLMRSVGLPAELDRAALTDPQSFESRASAAAGQALILMLAVFALFNLLLHPRTRIIEHIIYALYFHAALLPVVAAALLGAHLLQALPGSTIAIAVLANLATLVQAWRADRAFYGSSWYGASLRLPVLFIGYVTGLILAATLLILLPVL
jgi:hypothetical protein